MPSTPPCFWKSTRSFVQVAVPAILFFVLALGVGGVFIVFQLYIYVYIHTHSQNSKNFTMYMTSWYTYSPCKCFPHNVIELTYPSPHVLLVCLILFWRELWSSIVFTNFMLQHCLTHYSINPKSHLSSPWSTWFPFSFEGIYFLLYHMLIICLIVTLQYIHWAGTIVKKKKNGWNTENTEGKIVMDLFLIPALCIKANKADKMCNKWL